MRVPWVPRLLGRIACAVVGGSDAASVIISLVDALRGRTSLATNVSLQLQLRRTCIFAVAVFTT